MGMISTYEKLLAAVTPEVRRLWRRTRAAKARSYFFRHAHIEALDRRILLSAMTASSNGSSEIDLGFTVSNPNADFMQITRDSTVIYSGGVISGLSDTNLSPATTYSYSESDSDPDGNSDGSVASATTDGVAPAAPGLTASAASSSEIDLSLSADSTTTGMQIDRSDGIHSVTLYSGNPTSSFQDTGLSPWTTYYYSVTASNSWGPSGSSASATTAGVAPAAPGISATAHGSSAIDLALSADSTATGMQVYRSDGFTTWQIYSGDVTSSIQDTGLSPSTTYYYTATATNGYGNSDNTSASATTDGTAPSSPGISATPNGASEIDLSLSPDSTSSDMQISRSDGSTTWQIYSGIPVGNFADTGLSPWTTYYYSVTTSNYWGSSDSSASATTSGVVPAAPALTVAANGSGEIDVNLSADSTATGMQVYRSTNDSTFDQIYSGGITGGFQDLNLSPSTIYYYRATASNAYGISDATDASAVTDGTAPTAPGLSISGISSCEIDLSLSPDGATTGLQISRSTDGTTWSSIYSGGASTAFADTGLNPATIYYYSVTASNSWGTSGVASISATTDGVAPGTPGISASVNGSEIDLTLTPDSAATSVQIYRSTDNYNYSLIYSDVPLGTFQDSGLASSTTYYYTVTDSNAYGTSGSAGTSATTGPSNPTVLAAGISGGEIDLTITPDSNATSMQILRDGVQIYTGGIIGAFADTGLSPDSSYSYTVNTSNSSGSSSGGVSASTGPADPGITATSNGAEIDLTLTADSSATSMTILRNGTGIYSGGVITAFPDTGLPHDASYSYTVITSNANGSSSADASATTGPSDPAVVATGVNGSEIDLTLTPDTSATSMQIFRDGRRSTPAIPLARWPIPA